MKSFISHLPKYLLGGLLAAALVGAAVLVSPAGTVQAASFNPNKWVKKVEAKISQINFSKVPADTGKDTSKDKEGTPTNRWLEAVHQREKVWFESQARNLARMNNLVKSIDQRISNQKKSGKDTSVEEAALATFQSALADAQKLHDQAGALLTSHNGFGSKGEVVNAQQAADTLKSIAKDLLQARTTFRKELMNLRTASSDLAALLQAVR